MTNAASLQIVITGDTSSAKKAMRDLVGDVDKAESSFKRIRDVAAGVFGGTLLTRGFDMAVGGLKSFVSSAVESERVQAQLAATLRSTSGAAGMTLESLNALAQGLQSTTTYSDEAVGSAQAILLTFTNIKDNIFPQATETVLNMSTALGQDLQSSAVQLGKALQDPINGITSLRRVGVAFTDDQEKLIKKLIESGQGMEAQKMILKELATEFGGSATAAANTFAGKLAQLNNKFDEMKETVGRAIINAVLPYLDKFSRWFTENQTKIEQFFTNVVREVAKFGEDFTRGLSRINDALSWIPDNQGTIIAAVAAIGAAMALAFGPASAALLGLTAIVSLIGRIGTGSEGGIQNFVRDFAAQHSFFGGENVPSTMGQGTFDPAKGMFNTIEAYDNWKKLNDEAKKTPPIFNGINAAGGKVKTVLENISSAFSKLTSGPTRELADKQAKLAELQLKIAEGEAKGFDMSKSNVQQQIDVLQKSINVETAKSDVIKTQMDAANNALLTDKERDRVAKILIQSEKDATGHVQTFGQKLQGLFGDMDGFGQQLTTVLLQAQQVLAQPPAPPPAEPWTDVTVDGSHAGGLNYVPFDNYRALLHRGERVMTASENRGGGGTLQPIVLKVDGRELARVMVDLKNGGAFRGSFA